MPPQSVFVGCCGFAIGRRKYYALFDVVELQDTFYNPPDEARLSKLRGEAPPNFKFAMKAWQAITHPPNMRTWRRAKVIPPKDKWSRYGYLRPTRENFEAWEVIDNAAKALQAEFVVIQLPPSFRFTEENLENMTEFFSTIKPSGYLVGLEVRGDWKEHEAELKDVILRYDWLVHVVDPFRWVPVVEKEATYFRLHGIGGAEVNYRYKYKDEDLTRLREYVLNLSSREVYVLFNNIHMRDDALRFKELIKS